MKNIFSFVFVVAVVVLFLLQYRVYIEMQGQQKHIAVLLAEKNANTRPTSLDLQGKCAKQALEAFKQDGNEGQPFTSFTNHYNERLGKCFIDIESMQVDKSTHNPTNVKTVYDAFEGKVYAQYIWVGEQGKKYWEVAPMICKVTGTDGKEQLCHASDEFDHLIKVYMD